MAAPNTRRLGGALFILAIAFCLGQVEPGDDTEGVATQSLKWQNEVMPSPTTSEAASLGPEANGTRDIEKHVTCLAEDLQGRIWVGGEGNGLWCLDPSAAKGDQWRHFTPQDGLGDTTVYSLAVDKLGRVWAGHLNHGVSVYNGEKWQNYEMAAGLSSPDTLSGPLGERVYQIATSPVDGDVWMATSVGVTRYSLSKDSWSTITRMDGLPSDQISTVALDKTGVLYVGTQCDGIAIAKAGDNYKTWTRVKGPDALPQTATGRGLPTNLINQILVASDGSVYAGTDAGLAKSVDHGATWAYTRGRNWTRKLAMANTPAAKKAPAIPAQPGYMLAEDNITCLAEDGEGRILIGFRGSGYQILTPAATPNALATGGTLQNAPVIKTQASGTPPPLVRALLPSKERLYLGLYEGGLRDLPAAGTYVAKPATAAAVTPKPAGTPPLPKGAAAPSAAELQELGGKVAALSGVHPQAVFIGDDWRTQGDWVNHYGRQYAVIGAGLGPFDEFITSGPAYYRVYPLIGPNRVPEEGVRRWIHAVSDDHNLYDPTLGRRNETEWDDHGETYPMPIDGPDIHFEVTVPAGVSRVSIYFVNQLGRYKAERWRDMLMEVRKVPSELGGGRADALPLKGPLESDPPALPAGPSALPPDAAAPASWSTQPVLARARVHDFFEGVYKQFAVSGPGTFDFAVRRNYAFNTICSAVFIDRLAGPATSLDASPPILLDGPAYEPPQPQAQAADGDSSPTKAAVELWAKLDAAQGNPGVQPLDYPARVLAYRAASGSDSLAANWRWKLRLWSPDDRKHFQSAMADIWQYQMVNYPELHESVKIGLKPYKP